MCAQVQVCASWFPPGMRSIGYALYRAKHIKCRSLRSSCRAGATACSVFSMSSILRLARVASWACENRTACRCFRGARKHPPTAPAKAVLAARCHCNDERGRHKRLLPTTIIFYYIIIIQRLRSYSILESRGCSAADRSAHRTPHEY